MLLTQSELTTSLLPSLIPFSLCPFPNGPLWWTASLVGEDLEDDRGVVMRGQSESAACQLPAGWTFSRVPSLAMDLDLLGPDTSLRRPPLLPIHAAPPDPQERLFCPLDRMRLPHGPNGRRPMANFALPAVSLDGPSKIIRSHPLSSLSTQSGHHWLAGLQPIQRMIAASINRRPCSHNTLLPLSHMTAKQSSVLPKVPHSPCKAEAR